MLQNHFFNTADLDRKRPFLFLLPLNKMIFELMINKQSPPPKTPVIKSKPDRTHQNVNQYSFSVAMHASSHLISWNLDDLDKVRVNKRFNVVLSIKHF